VYLFGNASVELVGDNQWSLAGSGYPKSIRQSSPPIWLSGWTPMPTANDTVLNHVLRYSGARPAQRDSVDIRVVNTVRNRNGQMINCVSADGSKRCRKNAGGWPELAQNSRAVVLPSNPDAVTSSGYTNLELWLHQQAAVVEGTLGTATDHETASHRATQQ
jgi:hypothetical protein